MWLCDNPFTCISPQRKHVYRFCVYIMSWKITAECKNEAAQVWTVVLTACHSHLLSLLTFLSVREKWHVSRLCLGEINSQHSQQCLIKLSVPQSEPKKLHITTLTKLSFHLASEVSIEKSCKSWSLALRDIKQMIWFYPLPMQTYNNLMKLWFIPPLQVLKSKIIFLCYRNEIGI